MSLRINDEIPNLTVTTDHGELKLHDYIGDNWGILFYHPKDFTQYAQLNSLQLQN